MKVKNLSGTAQKNCLCGSWLKHWRKFSGQTTIFCSVPGCFRMDIVGAHVLKAVGYDYTSYIVPLCEKHNQASGELEVGDNIRLVAANVQTTCGI